MCGRRATRRVLRCKLCLYPRRASTVLGCIPARRSLAENSRNTPCNGCTAMRARHKTAARGFTLLELSIVLALIGVVTGGSLVMLLAGLQNKQFNTTVARMDTIEKALMDYRRAYNRLPCPSDLTLTPTTATDRKSVV